MAYRSYEGWQVLTRGQTTHCLRRVGEGRGRREGAFDSGGVRPALREDWGLHEVGGDGSEYTV